MDQQKLQELYKLHERAKRMERLGNDTEALNIYMEIHEGYFANTSDLYERPAVILEKKHRFQEAIDMCEKAIAFIKEDKITGTEEQFEKRISKLKERMANEAPKQIQKKTNTKIRWNPKDWKPADWLKALSVLVLLIGGLYLILPKQSAFEDVYVDVSQMERESELEGSPFGESEASQYVITENMIEIAKSAIKLNTEVADATIIPQDTSIGFGIITTPGTSKDKSENLAVEFIKALAGAATSEYPELAAPTALSLGGLYKHYDVIISVGDSPDNIIAKGTKNKDSNLINWRD